MCNKYIQNILLCKIYALPLLRKNYTKQFKAIK